MPAERLAEIPEAVVKAMADVWRLSPPGPNNLLSAPEFIRLREACSTSYAAGTLTPGFALSYALRSLGLPCSMPSGRASLSLSVEEATFRLDDGFRARLGRRIYFVPLDLAPNLPRMRFGSARVDRFDAQELEALVDAARLQRRFPSGFFDAKRFAEFSWLAIDEALQFDAAPEKRAVPQLFAPIDKDLGRIDPHEGRFPDAVENAIFFLLLAPWESWSEMHEVDWRGFKIPWVYSVNTDLFANLSPPPVPETLSWDTHSYEDGKGGWEEVEHPLEFQLDDRVQSELPLWDDSRWAMLQTARQSPLFEGPVIHFFVRAFLSEGIDEVLAHMMAIEAALGLSSDYRGAAAPTHQKRIKATDKMSFRVAGLLGDRNAAKEYKTLFNIRSAFVHGRTMGPISTQQRLLARSLARRVVWQLVLGASTKAEISRGSFLDDLLDQGVLLR